MINSTHRSPNVLVILTDQQRWDSVGLNGNPLNLTPNFDRLARRGTHLGNAFTCQPLCGPARSCLQTGQYATTSGVFHNGIPLPQGIPTLAECFRNAGYQTGYVGKWHLAGTDSPKGPVAKNLRGGYDYWLAAELLESTSNAYHTTLWDEQDEPHELPGYRVDAVADAVIGAVRKFNAQDRPFFLFSSFLEPHHQNSHDNYPAPEGYEQQYAGRWTPPDLASLKGTSAHHLPGYWGMVKRIDEALGRITDVLKSLDLEKETIVLFTSDHGCHFKTRNKEYKRSCHESSIHVPMGIWGPHFDGGGEPGELISLLDVPPTLLDACNVPVPETMEGRSLLPLLTTRACDWPDDVLIQISGEGLERAIRTQDWKYCVAAPGLNGQKQASSDLYIESELYDLREDPWEQRNLIHSRYHSDPRAAMRERMGARLSQTGEAGARIEEAELAPWGEIYPQPTA